MSGQIIITAEGLLALSVDGSLESSNGRDCRAYGHVFVEQAGSCDDAGDKAGADGWRLLSQVCEMMLHQADVSEPFQPMWRWGSSRAMVPADLRGEVASALHALAVSVEDAELRARLLDVVWEANRDYTTAEGAVEAYLQSARRLLDPDKWVAYVERCERALRLATSLGYEELGASVLSEIENTVVGLDGEDGMFLTCSLMSLLLEFRAGDVEVMSDIAGRAASLAEKRGGFDKARRHLENLVVCRRRMGDADGERLARSRIAESFEQQGVMQLEAGEYLAAAHWLEKGHVAYRQIGGMREKAGDVYVLLREAQRGAVAGMTTFEVPAVDVTEVVEQAEQHVSGYSFMEALWRLLGIVKTTDFEEAEKGAAQALEGMVWWKVVSPMTVEADGRIAARGDPPTLDESGDAVPLPWEQVVGYVVLRHHDLGLSVIRPAMRQVMLEHAPRLSELIEVVMGSPFVAFGHEGLFANGALRLA